MTGKNDQWTVPLNLGVSQILKIGKQPISVQVGGRYYAASRPEGRSGASALNCTLLFPTGKPKSRRTPPHEK